MLRLFIVTALIAFASCYDFKDSSFNEFLVDDLKSLSDDSHFLTRTRRDTAAVADSDSDKCHHERFKRNFECCKNDKPFDPKKFESFHEARKECYKTVVGEKDDSKYDPFSCESLKETKDNVICVTECVSKHYDTIDDKGEIKRDKLVSLLKDKFTDQPWKLEATEKVIDKCLEDIKKIEDKEEHKCNTNSLKMMHCMWKGFVQACPKDLQTESPKCQKIREKIEKGEDGYLKKIHFHKILHFHHLDDKDDEVKVEKKKD